MGNAATNPFSPGEGNMPPYRAGHEEAASCLEEHLASVCAKRAGDMVVLYGPRGNGKTVLLGELRERALKAGAQVVNLNPGEMTGDPSGLARLLVPEPKFPFLGIRRIMAGIAGHSAGMEFGAPPGRQVATVLRKRLAKSPLALIVDEAQHLPLDFGGILLNVAQECVNDRLPLLLAMAGTPDLPARFRKMGATFCERCERLRIGRLETEEATRDAFSVPARETGFPFDEDALDLLVRESQGYPFFVQVLGRAAWDAAAARSDAGARRITAKDSREGIEKAKERMERFHLECRDEAIEQGVLPVAVAVSEAMMSAEGETGLSEAGLADALRTVVPDHSSRIAAQNKLSHIGLIWQEDDLSWQPGIPSLCAYIARHGVGPEAKTRE